MTEFSPFAATFGGLLIGFAAVALMALHGRIAGVTGILSGLFIRNTASEVRWRAAFAAGLVVSPLVYLAITGSFPVVTVTASPLVLLAGGFLVGAGVMLSNGCTSGHGICGLARVSRRSLAAVFTFMATAIATVFVTRHMLGV